MLNPFKYAEEKLIERVKSSPEHLLAVGASPASAQINTGGVSGAYHSQFCPALSRELKLAQLDYACTPSAGTRENIERVLANPRQIGYGQLDVYALETRNLKAETALTVVRQDDVRECVFAVSRNPIYLADTMLPKDARTGRRRLDLIVATHRHEDHIKGFDPEWFEDIDVRNIWLSVAMDPGHPQAKGVRAVVGRITEAARCSVSFLFSATSRSLRRCCDAMRSSR